MARYRVQNTTFVMEATPPEEFHSWLDYWRDAVGDMVMPKRCFCCHRYFDRSSELTAGCVKRIDDKKEHLYFIPLCYTCNNPDSKLIFEVEEHDLILIPRKYLY